MVTIKDTLVEMFELDKLSPEKGAEMVERLGKLVFQAVLVRVLPMLSDQDMKEYERVVDSNEGGEAIFKFLSEKVANIDQIIMEESEALRAELAGEFKQAGI